MGGASALSPSIKKQNTTIIMKILSITLASLLISSTAFAGYYTPATNTRVSDWNNTLNSWDSNVITLRANSVVLVNANSTYTSNITSTNGGNQTFIFGSDGNNLYSFSGAKIHFDGDTSLTITLNATAVETVLSALQNEGNVFSQVIMQRGQDGYDYLKFPSYSSVILSGEVASLTLGSLEVLPRIVFSENAIHEGQIGIVATRSASYNSNIGGEQYSKLTLVAKGPTAPTTPESATATLSLLALAGVATRRRRK